MRAASRWISVLLHPILMPVLVLAMIMWADPHIAYFMPGAQTSILLSMVAILTVAFPLVSMLLLLRSKVITSLELPSRAERIVPFIMMMIYYAMTYFVLRSTHLHPIALSVFLGILISMAITIMVTLKWRISIHMVGIGGAIGAASGITALHGLPLLPLIAFLIVLAGLVGTARLIAGGHSHAQIYSGALLGWLVIYSCVVLEVVI